jgi:hypothetical protein
MPRYCLTKPEWVIPGRDNTIQMEKNYIATKQASEYQSCFKLPDFAANFSHIEADLTYPTQ